MIEKFLDFIRSKSLFTHGEPLLLAISGGVDSMVMADLFQKANFKFSFAHINYKLRGGDSDRDEAFVKSSAEQYHVSCFTKSFETLHYAEEKSISIQMAARELRYQWLEEIRKSMGFHYIATAHHQNDTIETVLINMFRGTGISGLHGIRMKQGKIIRPLLPFFKNEIYEYAEQHKIDFVEDKSNFETEYDRNKIRLEIIPAIEKHFPSFSQSFAVNIQKWSDAEWLYQHSVQLIKKRLLVEKDDEFIISIPRLIQYPPFKTILYELLKDFEFTPEQVAQISSSLEASPGKVFYSASYRLLKDRKDFIISRITSETVSAHLITEETKSVALETFRLRFDFKNASSESIPKNSEISCLDVDELEFPLLLRKWKKGDYFYPFGMKKKKKKISDYLIDRKIPLTEKEHTWIIESNNRIACIIGERIDDRFKITPSSKQMLVIQKQPK